MSQADAAPLPPELAAWIGRESRRTDVIWPRLAQCFAATLAPHLAATPGAPLGVFWCLAPDVVGPGELGPDGHPRMGLFLPAMPYPRRMWAGGELEFHGAFAVGDEVTKVSAVTDIAFKTGGTGKLAFITVRHQYRVADRLVLAERQDIVYRDAEGTGSQPRRPLKAEPAADVLKSWTVTTDPTLLFRYSALTFNGHRIHYDQPYATGREGYAGLVVHGPLQATLLLNLAAVTLGTTPARLSYRGQAPLICGEPARLDALRGEAGLALRVLDPNGTITMAATAVS